MSVRNLIQGASAGSTPTTTNPQGVDLDGALDYFSRSTDLTGNVDSKTFTFGLIIYPIDTVDTIYVSNDGVNNGFIVQLLSGGYFRLIGYNSAGTIIFRVDIPNNSVTISQYLYTFINIIVSVDLANSSNRYVVINDVVQTVTWTTYTNDTIDFTKSLHDIGANTAHSSMFKCRMQSLFLDYTYRDLSIEANRRLFIDANGKPADGWKALSPIIGMSMIDAATAHINDFGTGGNFTPNGTYVISNRGANQDNCSQLVLGGIDDYLSKTGFGGTSSKELTLSVNTKAKESATLSIISTRPITLQHIPASSKFSLIAYNSSNVAILNVDIPTSSIAINREYSLSLSIDLTNTSNRIVSLNGVNITSSCTWTTYTNDSIEYAYTGTVNIGLTTDYQEVGELYLHNTYVATLSRFWGNLENKPISARKVILDTGITPMVAMPMDASNSGKNYGSSGDYTANNAPYLGARGASEFWARSMKGDGTTGYLSRGALTGVADTKTFSIAFSIDINLSNTNMTFFNLSEATNGYRLYCRKSSTNELNFVGVNSANTVILNITTSTGGSYTIGSGSKVILASFDLANNVKGVYVNGVSNALTVTTFTNDFIDLGSILYSTIGAQSDGSGTRSAYFNGNVALCYFTTDYIDFSQEINRLKVVDAFGYPLDLAKQISSGAIPTPLFYLPFDDTTNLGKDASGNGNNFTVNGTVTAGTDVLG